MSHLYTDTTQLATGGAVRVRGFCQAFVRRFGHGVRLPQFQLDEGFEANYGLRCPQSVGRVPESSPYRVASADVGRAAGLAPEIAATAIATLVDRLGEAIQRGRRANLRFPHVGTLQSRGARVEFVFGTRIASEVDPGAGGAGPSKKRGASARAGGSSREAESMAVQAAVEALGADWEEIDRAKAASSRHAALTTPVGAAARSGRKQGPPTSSGSQLGGSPRSAAQSLLSASRREGGLGPASPLRRPGAATASPLMQRRLRGAQSVPQGSGSLLADSLLFQQGGDVAGGGAGHSTAGSGAMRGGSVAWAADGKDGDGGDGGEGKQEHGAAAGASQPPL